MLRRALALVVLANAVFLAALAAWAKAGWPGRPNHLLSGNAFYCEALRAGWIKQPANTWSCLGFIAMGLWLAAQAKSWRAMVLALFISLIGPGSMALHASFTAFGGALDVSSMFLFIGFCAAHDAACLSSFLEQNFAALLSAMCLAMVALAFWGSEHGPALFAALITAFLIGEVLVAVKGLAPARDRRRLAMAAGFFFSGYGCWILSEKSTGPWCSPYSWAQGHAAWHLLCALAAGSIYWYLEPELG